MKVVAYLKETLLCKNNRYLFCYANGEIVVRNSSDKKIIKRKRIHNVILSVPLLARMLRLIPRAAISLLEDECIISDCGQILRYSVLKNSIVIEHHFLTGMSAPISFCVRYGPNRLVEDILYGEYTQNPQKGSVSIYRRKNCEWVRVYSFPSNTIKHIHNIVVDKKRKRYLILTGDEDIESGIWESDFDFNYVRPLKLGSQQLRMCVLLPLDQEMYYVTDTPLEINYVYRLSLDLRIKKLFEVNGPCIFGCIKNDDLFFSTSVEGDSRKSKIRYLLTYKLGKGVKNRYSCIYRVTSQGVVEEIIRFRKDWLPIALFEFGNIKFPISDDDKVYFCPQSLKAKYGTYVIEK